MDNNNNLIKQNLRELQRLTLLNILSAKGIIYTHYKNKQLNKEDKHEQKNKSRALVTSS
jgi:cell division protein FtsL